MYDLKSNSTIENSVFCLLKFTKEKKQYDCYKTEMNKRNILIKHSEYIENENNNF